MLIKKLDEELNLQQAALRIRSQRQELLASNIANADTPQYKAKDIDFKAAMQSAMQQMSGKNPTDRHASLLQQTDKSHLNGEVNHLTTNAGDALYRSLVQGSVDGNTVDMDVERNAYVDNGIRYEAGLTFVTDKLKEVMAAINGS